MRHLLEAAHHSLVSEVVGKSLCPFCQELHDLWGDVTDPLLSDGKNIDALNKVSILSESIYSTVILCIVI